MDGRNDKNEEKVSTIKFEANHSYEYFEKDAIEGCLLELDKQIQQFILDRGLDEINYFLSPKKYHSEINPFVGEYECSCSQILNIIKQ